MTTETKPQKPHVQYLEAITGLIELIGSMSNRLEALEMQQNANHISFSNRLTAIEKRLDVIEAWLSAEEENATK